MARTPKLRVNFEADVAYLLRLKQAIEDDKGWPQEWKEGICVDIGALALKLMQKPEKTAVPDEGGSGEAA